MATVVTDEEFELEVFRQVNEHLRATDRKYWVSSGAFLSLLVLYISKVQASHFILASPEAEAAFELWKSVTVDALMAVFSLLIYLMQTWYRAWKEHYLDVIHKLRGKLYPDQNANNLLPFWLRQRTPEQAISVDNSLKAITFIVTSIFVILVCAELYYILSGLPGMIVGGVVFLVYCAALFRIERSIHAGNQLNA